MHPDRVLEGDVLHQLDIYGERLKPSRQWLFSSPGRRLLLLLISPILLVKLVVQNFNLCLQLVSQVEQLSMPQMNRILGSHPWIPSTVVTLPELHVPNGCNWEESHSGVEGLAVHGVEEQAPLLITVAEEGAKEAGVEVVEHHAQQILVELESVGELLHHLPNAVNKLKEDGTSVCIVVLVVSMPCTLCKLVPKAQPLFLDQNLEALL